MLTAYAGPIVAYGDMGAGYTDPDKAPSLFWGGSGLFDPRMGYGQQRDGTIGFAGGSTLIPVIDAVPSTLTTTAIAAAQVPVAGTAMTLVSTTGAGITVLSAALKVYPSGNTVPVGALAIDGAPGVVAFGSASVATGNTKISLYDPTKALARNIQIASVGNDTGGTFLVSGYDIYGYPMSERITGANAGTATGTKAFKFVTSVVPAGTLSGSNVSVGQGDKYGFPLRVDSIGYVSIWFNNLQIASSATGTFTFADTTTATTTTGDVRGTYLVASASNATKRLQMFITPSIANLGSNTGLFGVTQA